MTKQLRALVMVVLVLTMTTFTAARAGAENDETKRDQTRRKRQDVQSQLDLARASDDKVEAEVARLTQAVTAQDAALASARQAQAAADGQVAVSARRLAEVEARQSASRQALAQRAVAEYVHPSGSEALRTMMQAGSLDEASTRQTFLSVVQSRTSEVIGALRAAKEDEAISLKEFRAAQEVAASRAADQTEQANILRTAQQSQLRVRIELQGRIASLQKESDALAAQEDQLQQLIRARSAPRASAASAAPTPARGSPAAPAAAARRPSGGRFAWPANGPVTSEFGFRWGKLHAGLDISDPEGTPIAASRAGTVIFSGPNGAYGNFIVIDHGDGFSTAYAHQSRLGASEGQTVAQGDTIGYVGTTGASTGNHLHFEVRVDGAAQNPRDYL